MADTINRLRHHVDQWRQNPDPIQWKVTPETARLLQHWRNYPFVGIRPFFCQIEAVETLIWLTEVAPQLGKTDQTFLDHLEAVNKDAGSDLMRLALKLATALAFAVCQMGFTVRFFGVTALVTQLLERREGRQLERFFKQLERSDLLVLDELGYVPFSKLGAELLFEVVSRAYERTSLVVTTNLPFESWTEVLGSQRLTGALLDRLTHRVHILEANGESF